MADPLPALYDVTGVASDDVLNVRADPNASAGRIGKLTHTATGVEVIALDPSQKWALINTRQRTGWVSLRFLERQAGQDFISPRQCFGTEPFWSLALADDGAVLSWMGEDDRPLTGSAVPSHLSEGLLLRLADDRTTLLIDITAEACSDGMSDRAYGLATRMVEMERDTTSVYWGCCSVAP